MPSFFGNSSERCARGDDGQLVNSVNQSKVRKEARQYTSTPRKVDTMNTMEQNLANFDPGMSMKVSV